MSEKGKKKRRELSYTSKQQVNRNVQGYNSESQL